MKLVIQRVKRASVKVEERIVGQIGPGLFLLIGFENEAKEQESRGVKKIAEKVLKMRIFENEKEKFDKSIIEIGGEILVVPQFTLFADCSKGNRPYFGQAARPEIAKPLFEKFVQELKKSSLKIETGVFGAKMEVELINDGPVTIILS